MLRRLTLTTLLVFCASFSFAGDAAQFENLGFSTNERTFMFAQYGVDRASSAPYADIFTVNVPENEFVSGGVFSKESDRRVSAGYDGRAALYALIHDASDVISRRSIDHLRQGRIVYARLNESVTEETIEFRDFDTGHRYQATLHQERNGAETDVRARFHIELTREHTDTGRQNYTVGLPNYYRDGVSEYRIHQAILSPDERSLVFVVEMIRPTSGGHSIRYMVETLRFDS